MRESIEFVSEKEEQFSNVLSRAQMLNDFDHTNGEQYLKDCCNMISAFPNNPAPYEVPLPKSFWFT